MLNNEEVVSFVAPKHMNVLKRTNVSYASYWNEEKHKWGGLIEATIFGEETPNIENSEVIDYRVITGTKKQ